MREQRDRGRDWKWRYSLSLSLFPRLHVQIPSRHGAAQSGDEPGRHEGSRLGKSVTHDAGQCPANSQAEISVGGIDGNAICCKTDGGAWRWTEMR